ncbi:phosphatase PAP2 family protein [Azospirillum halopraeferens]|uniref:phosphatase PAP2 family protein n=1 Tax=Azospirillum halopraeferens TaxID=34010 RepID=UPI00041F9D32|nr:phosphatase PAP2 family protein [Azospirillum halopraeferens]
MTVAGLRSWLHRIPYAERVGLGTLVLLLLVGGGVWGFVLLADLVIEGETEAFDRTVLLALRNPADVSDPLGPRWLEEMGRDITALGSMGVLTMLTLAVTGYLAMRRLWRAAALLPVSVGGGMLVSTLLKMVFERARPDLVPHGAYVYTASFPSGHSMMAAVTYLTLGALLARVEPDPRIKAYILTLAVAVTVLVGVSRVYLGVHWPTDVLAGWTVGAAWALTVWLVARWLQRRGDVEKGNGRFAF